MAETTSNPGTPVGAPPLKVDIAKATEWLRSKCAGTEPTCPVCQSPERAWAIAPDILHMPMINTTWNPPYLYPFVVLTCMHCANSLLFNAVIMGLYPAGKQSE
jgi:hypothetical protein